MVSKKIASLAGAALLLASTGAVAQAAAPSGASALSLSGARVGADLDDANSLGGSAIVIPALFLAAVFAVALLAYNSEDDGPSSP